MTHIETLLACRINLMRALDSLNTAIMAHDIDVRRLRTLLAEAPGPMTDKEILRALDVSWSPAYLCELLDAATCRES